VVASPASGADVAVDVTLPSAAPSSTADELVDEPLDEPARELPYPTQPTPLRLSSYSFPASKSTSTASGIPIGVEMIPLAMLKPPAVTFNMPPVVCSKCGAARNKYCAVDLAQGTWKCVLCGLQNISERYVSERVQDEFSAKCTDYIVPSEVAETMSPAFRSGITEQFLVLVVDANLTAEYRDVCQIPYDKSS